MHQQTLAVTLGCLLHDIGKITYRAGESASHSASGYAYLRELGLPLPQEALDCVRWHHARELREAAPPPDSLAYIACTADNISAAADRREEGDEARFDRNLALSPVFSHLNGEHGGYTLEAKPQDGTLRMPRTEDVRPDAGVYRDVLRELTDALKALEFGPEWVDSLLSALECFTGSVPSSTFRGESPDISLFDHLKTTAAAGACISEFLLDSGETDLRTTAVPKGSAVPENGGVPAVLRRFFRRTEIHLYRDGAGRAADAAQPFVLSGICDGALCGRASARLRRKPCQSPVQRRRALLYPAAEHGAREAGGGRVEHPLQRMAVCPVRHKVVPRARIYRVHGRRADQHARRGRAL